MTEKNEKKCRVCSCTEARACEGGCSWVKDDLCSRCTGEIGEIKLAVLAQLTRTCFKGRGAVQKAMMRAVELAYERMKDQELLEPEEKEAAELEKKAESLAEGTGLK